MNYRLYSYIFFLYGISGFKWSIHEEWSSNSSTTGRQKSSTPCTSSSFATIIHINFIITLQGLDSKDLEGPKQDLKSRGLCLVPIPSTFPLANETTPDFWTPTFGGIYR